MTSFLSMSMNRRAAFKLGAGLGVAGGAGLLGYQVVPPSPSPELERVDVLARQLYGTLDAEQRADSCVPYDHPLRRYHNRGVWGYPEEIVAGRLRPGPIRSGDIYTLESWQDSVEVGEVHGSTLDGTAFAQLASPAGKIDRMKMYTVGTTVCGVSQLREHLGRVESPQPRGMLRDLAAYVRRDGFGRVHAGA